jgi:hypothetical protein
MLKKYGKFFARWTEEDGHRHIKAFSTKRAALKFQGKMRREHSTKKAKRPGRPSVHTSTRGRKSRTSRASKRSQGTSPKP